MRDWSWVGRPQRKSTTISAGRLASPTVRRMRSRARATRARDAGLALVARAAARSPNSLDLLHLVRLGDHAYAYPEGRDRPCKKSLAEPHHRNRSGRQYLGSTSPHIPVRSDRLQPSRAWDPICGARRLPIHRTLSGHTLPRCFYHGHQHSEVLALSEGRQIRSFRQISNVAEVRTPFSSTGERQTRQPDPALCPAHLRFRYCSYGSMTYSNQFCLNERKNSIFPSEYLTFG